MKKLLLTSLIFSSVAFAKGDTFTETLYPTWGQTFQVSKILMEEKNDLQHLVIFENEQFGKVLALDGIIQTTEKDEFVYHEMITHVPLLAHGNAQKILVVGGGDGGVLRVVLRHKNVRDVTLVEIDRRVIDLCKKYFPNHSKGAFEDPRVRIVIQDAYDFVGQIRETFDVIICDTTDPIGPGEVLFSHEFYARCKKLLTPGGIIVTQCGVPFMQTEELVASHKHLSSLFKEASFYRADIPTYVGGCMTLGWATDNVKLRTLNHKILEQRLKKFVIGEMQYYTPSIHIAAFALPKFVVKALTPDEVSIQPIDDEVSIQPIDDEVSILPIETSDQE
jgi:spermidine synthase